MWAESAFVRLRVAMAESSLVVALINVDRGACRSIYPLVPFESKLVVAVIHVDSVA